MAKKKRTRRRASVGAMSLNPKSPLMKIAAVAAGFLLSDTIQPMITKIIPTKTVTPATSTTVAVTAPLVPTQYVAGAEVGLGGLLLLKGKSSLVKTAVGGVVAGVGLKTLLTSLGVLKGFQNVPVLGRRMAGYQNTPVLGAALPAALSGTDNNGFRVNGNVNQPSALSGYIPNGSGVGIMGSLYTNGSGINNTDR